MARPAFVQRLCERTFIELFVYPDLFAEFLAFYDRPYREVQRWVEIASVVAVRCDATPAQLAEAIRVLEAEVDHGIAQMIARDLRVRALPETPGDNRTTPR